MENARPTLRRLRTLNWSYSDNVRLAVAGRFRDNLPSGYGLEPSTKTLGDRACPRWHGCFFGVRVDLSAWAHGGAANDARLHECSVFQSWLHQCASPCVRS